MLDFIAKNAQYVPELLLAAVVLVELIIYIIKTKKQKRSLSIEHIKSQILQLFLYAEKQPWLGPEKMKFVVRSAYSIIMPDQFERLVPDEKLDAWINKLYDEFKSWLQANNVAEENTEDNNIEELAETNS